MLFSNSSGARVGFTNVKGRERPGRTTPKIEYQFLSLHHTKRGRENILKLRSKHNENDNPWGAAGSLAALDFVSRPPGVCPLEFEYIRKPQEPSYLRHLQLPPRIPVPLHAVVPPVRRSPAVLDIIVAVAAHAQRRHLRYQTHPQNQSLLPTPWPAWCVPSTSLQQ